MSPSRLRTGFRTPDRLPALLALAAALVAPATAEESERSRIAQERAEIEARYAERERLCRERFVVTACVDAARRDRRRDLDALRAREVKLDEQGRRERAAARSADLAAKAADDARRERERGARAASAPGPAAEAPARVRPPRGASPGAERQPGGPRDRPAPVGKGLGIEPTHRDSAAERREREERSRARYAERQRVAAEHRREVLEQAARRLERGKAAAPLPVPGASTPR